MIRSWRILVLSLALLGCFGDLVDAAQVYSINVRSEPESLDSALATGAPENDVLQALFEGLVTLNAKTLEAQPGVATRWDISEDGKRYVFHLRGNARWSNGDKVTADDFYYSWKRVLEPATAANAAFHLYYIEGAQAFNKGELKDFSKVGVKVLEGNRLEVRLEKPISFFLFLCSYYTLFPVHQKTVEKHGNRWTRAGTMVSNGPFKLKQWRQKDRIVVEKSSHYWDAASVRLNQINFLPIESKETSLNLYKTGKLDWTGRSHLPDARIERLRKRPDFHSPVILATYMFRFNTTRAPFDNLDVRKALFLAVDRRTIVERVTRAGEQPASSLTPKMRGYQPPVGPTFNPRKAAEHLQKAGYCTPENTKNCKPFPKFEVLYNTNETHKTILLAIQQMWKKHLGIDQLALVNKEWKVYLRERRTMDYSIARASWIADYPDPYNFLQIFLSTSSHNQTGWSSEKYDTFVKAAVAEVDPARRERLYQQAEGELLQGVPIIPIYFYTSPSLVNSSVEGFFDNALDRHPYKSIYIKENIKAKGATP